MSGLEKDKGEGIIFDLGTTCAKLGKPGTLLISMAHQGRVR